MVCVGSSRTGTMGVTSLDREFRRQVGLNSGEMVRINPRDLERFWPALIDSAVIKRGIDCGSFLLLHTLANSYLCMRAFLMGAISP